MADETLLDTGAPTRRDEPAVDAPAATRLDAAPMAPRRSVFNLPVALEARFGIVEPLPTSGAEAELLIVESLANRQRFVAKLYRPGIQPKTEVLQRVSGMAPEHVVKLIEHGESDGLWYELLEFCRFGSLRRFLRGRPIPPRYVERIFTEVYRSLAELHDAGIIHRDLKPENVLIRATDPLDLVLTDFGISSIADASQHFTSASRTVKYGAPEASSGVISARADYWSLGMMALEALTGRHPFDGLSEPVINQRLATRPIDVSNVTDERWHVLCRGLLHRNPEERWDAPRVERWLCGDSNIAVAIDDAHHGAPATVAPYTIEGVSCTTAAELGIALARHWRTGVKDLARGFIAQWVQRELKDLELSRFLHDLAEDTQITPDMRLLRLILRLVPGIPPLWRGEPLERDSLFAMAVKASTGDEAAGEWIRSLSDQRVLSVYANAGVTRLADLEAAWTAHANEVSGFIDRLFQAEKASLAAAGDDDRPPDMDALMFGSGRLKALALPHADILQSILGEDYEATTRVAVRGHIAEAGVDCDWYASLGSVDELNAAQLVAMKAVFPHALQFAKNARDRRSRRAEASLKRVSQLQGRMDGFLAGMRELRDADFGQLAGNGRTASLQVLVLTERLTEFREIEADAASVAADSDQAQSFRNLVSRVRFTVNAIEPQLRTIRSWVTRSSTVSGTALVIMYLVYEVFPSLWAFAAGIILPVGTFAWFALLRWRANGQLRDLIRRLPAPSRSYPGTSLAPNRVLD